jgi:precorrin-3B synthase
MVSGDGLIVRVRPPCGRLTAEQAKGIAVISTELGNGIIDVTSRSNLQIRGLAEHTHLRVLERLSRLGLLDESAQAEALRNILLTPFWQTGDDAHEIAVQLENELATLPVALPGKFGFAVDCGPKRLLADCPADIRIERGESGRLILRADGNGAGLPVSPRQCARMALALAEWFVASGGAKGGRGRMSSHIGAGAIMPSSLVGRETPARVASRPAPGLHAAGALIGLAFGQLSATTLSALASLGHELRMTPWRMVLVPGLAEMPQDEGLVTRPDDPLLRVVACTGAPGCPQAHAPTRAIARLLAASVPEGALLHVSGCAKGCAHPDPAGVTLVAAPAGFDLVRNGRAADPAVERGLTGLALATCLSSLAEAH